MTILEHRGEEGCDSQRRRPGPARHDDGRLFTSEVRHGLQAAPRHPAADGLDDAAALDAGPAVGPRRQCPVLDDAHRL